MSNRIEFTTISTTTWRLHVRATAHFRGRTWETTHWVAYGFNISPIRLDVRTIQLGNSYRKKLSFFESDQWTNDHKNIAFSLMAFIIKDYDLIFSDPMGDSQTYMQSLHQGPSVLFTKDGRIFQTRCFKSTDGVVTSTDETEYTPEGRWANSQIAYLAMETYVTGSSS